MRLHNRRSGDTILLANRVETEMKALVLNAHGDIENFQIGEIAMPLIYIG